MSEKYLPPSHLSNGSSRLLTNDLYFAATLLCQGAHLERLIHNGRRRISFEFVGEDLHRLKAEYDRDEARVPVRSFRNNLLTVRRWMDLEQRSAPCPQSLTALSKV